MIWKYRKVIASVLWLLVFALLLHLGFWQLDRAQEKKRLIELNLQRDNSVAVDFVEQAKVLSELEYRNVILHGHYDIDHQFLQDNQIHDGVAGYMVLTPFLLEGSDRAILVNRGWIAGTQDRKNLPRVSFNVSPSDVTGQVRAFFDVGLRLNGAEIPSRTWPSVVQVIEPKILAAKLGYEVLPFQLLLAPDQVAGYARRWEIKYQITPDKHQGYAVQWFSLAAALVLLTGWYLLRTKSKES